MKISQKVVIAILALLLTGCATVWDPEHSEDKRPMHAASAGAVGAGIGAIVGHQTGNTSAGMAIGGATGAASGYWASDALTYDIDEQERRLDRIEEQKRILAEQRDELSRLRGEVADPYQPELDYGFQRERTFRAPLEATAPDRRPGQLVEESDLAEPEYTATITLPNSESAVNREMVMESERRAALAVEQPPTSQGQKRQGFDELESEFFGNSTHRSALSQTSEELNQEATRALPSHEVDEEAVAKIAVIPEHGIENNPIQGQWRQRTADMPKRAGMDTMNQAQQQSAANVALAAKGTVAEAGSDTTSAVKMGKEQVSNQAVESRRDEQQQVAVLKKDTKADVAEPVSVYCEQAASDLKRAETSSDDTEKLMLTKRALRYCPEKSSVRIRAAKLYVQLDRKDDAKREASEVLRVEPGNAEAKAIVTGNF